MIMATDRVELFDNDIQDNQTASIALVSYLSTQKKLKDPDYDPISEAVNIHDNRIFWRRQEPSGRLE